MGYVMFRLILVSPNSVGIMAVRKHGRPAARGTSAATCHFSVATGKTLYHSRDCNRSRMEVRMERIQQFLMKSNRSVDIFSFNSHVTFKERNVQPDAERFPRYGNERNECPDILGLGTKRRYSMRVADNAAGRIPQEGDCTGRTFWGTSGPYRDSGECS
jgi:hypothetical protein